MECDKSNGYDLINGRCVIKDRASYMNIKYVNFVPTSSILKVRFTHYINIDREIVKKLEIRVVNSIDQTVITTLDGNMEELTAFDSGFDVRLKIGKDLKNIHLEVDVKSGVVKTKVFPPKEQNVVPFSAFPITSEDTSVFDSGLSRDLISAANKSMIVGSSMRSISTILLMLSNPAVGILLDRVFCEVGYLGLMTPQNLSYTRVLLEVVNNANGIPILEENPFEEVADEPKCEASDNMEINEISCNTLKNYGSDIIFLGVSILIALILSLSAHLILKHQKEKYKTKPLNGEGIKKKLVYYTLRSVVYLSTVLGLTYVLLKLDGNILDIFYFSLVNMKYMVNSKYMILGLVVSIIFTLYYLHYMYSLFVFSRILSRYMSTMKIKKLTEGFEEVMKEEPDKFRFKYLKIMYESFKYPIVQRYYIYHPFISAVRYVVISLLITTMDSLGFYLSFAATLVECSYYWYIVISPMKESNHENFIEQFNTCMHVLFNMLSILAHFEVTDEFLNALDISLLVLLSLKLIANGYIVFYELIPVIYNSIKYSIKKLIEMAKNLSKKKKEQGHGLEEENIESDKNEVKASPSKSIVKKGSIEKSVQESGENEKKLFGSPKKRISPKKNSSPILSSNSFKRVGNILLDRIGVASNNNRMQKGDFSISIKRELKDSQLIEYEHMLMNDKHIDTKHEMIDNSHKDDIFMNGGSKIGMITNMNSNILSPQDVSNKFVESKIKSTNNANSKENYTLISDRVLFTIPNDQMEEQDHNGSKDHV